MLDELPLQRQAEGKQGKRCEVHEPHDGNHAAAPASKERSSLLECTRFTRTWMPGSMSSGGTGARQSRRIYKTWQFVLKAAKASMLVKINATWP